MENPMKTHLFAVLAAALVASSSMAAELRWSSNDTFQHIANIAPGKAAELCGGVEPRLPVDWRYVADGPLSFNIHRHSGAEVVYAIRSYLTREQNGTFSPTFNFDWCWMWTNETADAVTVRVELKR